jgi:hypothetical protein
MLVKDLKVESEITFTIKNVKFLERRRKTEMLGTLSV